jgi:hypothetical protein
MIRTFDFHFKFCTKPLVDFVLLKKSIIHIKLVFKISYEFQRCIISKIRRIYSRYAEEACKDLQRLEKIGIELKNGKMNPVYFKSAVAIW